MSHVKGRIIGIFGVGAVGALAALLFAPKSGKDLRKDIRKKTDKYYDETEKFIGASKEKAKNIMNSGLTIFASAKNKTGNVLSTGKEIVDGETTKLKTATKSRAKTIKKTKKL
jgi:gas vesicle protein